MVHQGHVVHRGEYIHHLYGTAVHDPIAAASPPPGAPRRHSSAISMGCIAAAGRGKALLQPGPVSERTGGGFKSPQEGNALSSD